MVLPAMQTTVMRNYAKLQRALQDALAEFLLNIGITPERVKDDAALAMLLIFSVLRNHRTNVMQLVRKFPLQSEAEIIQSVTRKYKEKPQGNYSPQLQYALAAIEAAQTGQALVDASLLGSALAPHEKDIARKAVLKRNKVIPPDA
jgi:hypothetical protein